MNARCLMLVEVGIVAMHFCAVKTSVNSSCIICSLSMLSTITASQRHLLQHVSILSCSLSPWTYWSCLKW